MTIAPELLAELQAEPRWMYEWELDDQRSPLLHPMLPSIHRTRASLLEGAVRSALAEAGPGARALDLACCEGWFAHRLLEWGADEVLGVDIRAQSIHRAELVRDHLGVDPERLRFQTADVLTLDPSVLGQFDVVLCLGLIYHVEHPMGVLRVAHSLTRRLLGLESQTARVVTPALFGFPSRGAQQATNAAIALHREPDHEDNPLASFGGALSFCPNPEALELMVTTAGFTSVERPQPEGGHDQDFFTGDRLLLLARP